MRTLRILLIGCLAMVMSSCAAGKKSAAGFHLPDGDPVKGKEAFIALKCHTCHQVANMQLPVETLAIPRPILLGGETLYVRTDGELVTAIVDPSYQLAQGYSKNVMALDGHSRMHDYSQELTVRQLIDLVSFLQSRYRIVPPPTSTY